MMYRARRIPQLWDPEWLRRAYVDDGLSQQAIADRLGCGQVVVSVAMRRHGIQTRRDRRREEATLKRCSKCDELKPIVEYGRVSKVRTGLSAECTVCAGKRKRRAELISSFPNGPTATNHLVDLAPDRQPAVRLRLELQRRRDAGERFSQAWPMAVEVAVRELPPGDAAEWVLAFQWAQTRWLAGYRPDLVCGRTRLFAPDEPEPERVAA